jgi:hypothetical protein
VNTLARVAVDLLHADPRVLAATPTEDRPIPSEIAEATEIVVNAADARKLAALPAGADVSARVIDQLGDRVLIVIREDEETLLAGIDPEASAERIRLLTV